MENLGKAAVVDWSSMQSAYEFTKRGDQLLGVTLGGGGVLFLAGEERAMILGDLGGTR